MAMHQLKTGANKIHSNTELLIELQALHRCLTWKQEWNWNGRTSQRLMDLIKSVRKPLADELGKLHKTPFLEKRISFFLSNRERQSCLLYSLRQFISLHDVLTFLSLKRTADRNSNLQTSSPRCEQMENTLGSEQRLKGEHHSAT